MFIGIQHSWLEIIQAKKFAISTVTFIIKIVISCINSNCMYMNMQIRGIILNKKNQFVSNLIFLKDYTGHGICLIHLFLKKISQTKVVSSNPAHDRVYSIQQYVIKLCRWLATGLWFSPGTPVSSTNKTDRHDITEICLFVCCFFFFVYCKISKRCICFWCCLVY